MPFNKIKDKLYKHKKDNSVWKCRSEKYWCKYLDNKWVPLSYQVSEWHLEWFFDEINEEDWLWNQIK